MIRVFPYPQYIYSNSDTNLYINKLTELKKFNDKFYFDGILIFTTLEDPDDHWELAHFISRSSKQMPVIAINPNWEHPVITARKIITFQHLQKKTLAINWITGALLSDNEKIGITLSKEDRYEKLFEYITIVNELLEGKKIQFEGKYFQTKNYKLKRELKFPILQFISGTSEGCDKILEKLTLLNRLVIGMNINHVYPKHSKGIGFGLIVRDTRKEAFRHFNQTFPENPVGEKFLALSEKNTDSQWRLDLIKQAKKQKYSETGLFASTLKNYADNGWFVGSYDDGFEYIRHHINLGIENFFINLIDPNETQHINTVFNRIKKETQPKC